MQREITTINTTAFDQYESNVRSYCRSFPTVFRQAQGSLLYNEQQRAYIDFFAGAGALNYGHNNPQINKPCSTTSNPTKLSMAWICILVPNAAFWSGLIRLF